MRAWLFVLVFLTFGGNAYAQQAMAPHRLPAGEWPISKSLDLPGLTSNHTLCGDYFRFTGSPSAKPEQMILAFVFLVKNGARVDTNINEISPNLIDTHVTPSAGVPKFKVPLRKGPALGYFEIWVTPEEFKKSFSCLKHTQVILNR